MWRTTSHVAACNPPRVFAWNVNGPLIIGPNLSATGRAMEANPEQARQILANRREQHRGILNLQGIKRLAEAGG